MTEVEKEFCGVNDIAKLLNVSRASVYRYIKEDELPAYKIGGVIKFDIAEVKAWAKEIPA